MDHLNGNMVWFMGVVEDTADPFKLNRVRVRCFNIHPDNKNLVPTQDLPWAITTVGRGMNLIEPGDWAVGFFLDGKDAQQPFIFGTFTGLPIAKPDTTKGFCDPSGIFPQHIGEATSSRLARNENLDSHSIAFKRNNPISGVRTGDGSTWSEPVTSYSAVYPSNKVIETPNGLSIELDDTSCSQRIAFYHPKGSWIEFNPDGSVSYRASGNKYSATLSDECVFIGGNSLITVLGDASIQVNGSVNSSVSGDVNWRVGGNFNMSVENDVNIVAKNINSYASNNYNITGTNFYSSMKMETNYTSGTAYNIKSGTDTNIQATGILQTESGGNLSFKAGGSWALDATSYHMNEELSTVPATASPASSTSNISSGIVGTSFNSPNPYIPRVQDWSAS